MTVAFSRAQPAGAKATAFQADGVTLEEFSLNVPRFNGAARRMLVGGQRINAVSNPRGEGLIAGTPGTSPANWGSDTTNRIIHGITVISGLPLLDLTYAPTGAGNRQLAFSASAMTAASGEVWTASCFVRLETGTGVSANIDLEFRNSAGTIVGGVSSALLTTVGALTHLKVTGTAPALTARAAPQIRFTYANATTARARYGVLQCEIGAFASTPILPAVGTPTASTRGADILTIPIADLGIAPNGACTIVGDFMLPQSCPSGTNQTLLFMDDNSGSNRCRLINSNGTAQIKPSARAAGVDGPNVNAGLITPGVPFRVAIRIDGLGNIAVSLNGGSVFSCSGAPTSGLTTLRIGHDNANGQNLNGEVGCVYVVPPFIPVSNDSLRALSSIESGIPLEGSTKVTFPLSSPVVWPAYPGPKRLSSLFLVSPGEI